MGLLQRKPVRALLIVVGVVVVAALAVKIFLPAGKIRDLALAQARERLGREVTVGDVSVSLRGGLGVRLADFAVQNPDGFGGEPLLQTAGVDLKLAVRPLLGGEVRVHRLVIDGPRLNLVRRADGSDNFTFPAAPDGPADATAAAGAGEADAPPPLSIASLTLADGALTFTDEGAAAGGLRSVALQDVTLSMGLDDPAPGAYHAAGRLAAGRIAVDGPGQVPDLDAGLDFDVTWHGDTGRLDLVRLSAEVLGLPLAADGSLTVADGAATGLVKVTVDEQPLVRLWPFLPPELAGRLGGDEGSGTVGAQVDLTLTGDAAVPVRTRGTAQVNDADLALAQPFLPPGQPGRLAGRGDLAVSFVDTTGDPDRLAYQGTATVRGASYTESGLVDELQRLDAELAFTPDAFTVTRSRAVFGSGSFDLTGRLDDPFPYFLPPELQEGKTMKTPHLGFELRSDRLDVDRLIPPASPTGAAAPGAEPGMTRKPPVPEGVEFPDITCDGTFAADTVIYMQVPLTEVSGKTTIRDRQLAVHDVTADVYEGKVSGTLDVDLRDLQDPAYKGTYAAQGIEVNDFVTRFAGLKGVLFGACDLSGDFGASGYDPQAILAGLTLDADALIADGRVVTTGGVNKALNSLAAKAGESFDENQSLRDLATRIEVKEGRVGVNDLKTRLGRFADVSVSGSYAFTGELEYRGDLLLTTAQTDALFAGGAMAELARLLGSEKPARLRLPVTVGGTRSAPVVKIGLDEVLGELQKAVVREQKGKLEDEAKDKLGDLLKKWGK